MSYAEQPNAASSFPPMMREDPDFDGEEFLQLSPYQRVQFCTQSAEQAHNRANLAPEPHKGFYIEIARQWLLLAESIIQDAQAANTWSDQAE
jgi:hypothetical protein